MKVTKFGQSCLLIEKGEDRLLIDPGSFFSAKHQLAELGKISGVLYTHQHADHCDVSLFEPIRSAGVKMYGNSDVAAKVGQGIETVSDGQEFGVASFKVKAHDLPHCLLPGSEPPPNTGYIIDGVFFHPGDGVETSGFRVDALGVAIAGPDVSPLDAINLIQALGARKAIPMHYDFFKEDPEVFKQAYGWTGGKAEIIALADGESTEL